MKLVKVEIENYRSIESSGVVEIEDTVTCLVGKNESGKTAFLQAIYKTNPYESAVTYDEVIDFPSRLTRLRHETQGPIDVATLTFAIDEPTLKKIESEFGKGVLPEAEFSITSAYRRDRFVFNLEVDERIAIRHLQGQLTLTDENKATLDKSKTVASFLSALETFDSAEPTVAAMTSRIKSWRESRLLLYIYDTYLKSSLPKMVYFDEYDSMPGKISIPDLIHKRDANNLTRGESSLLALFDVVNVKLEDFSDTTKHEYIIRELENAANSISDEVFEYWSQNRDLAVTLEILNPESGASPP